MTDLETTIEYYKDLLLYQYINSPNARATVGLLVAQAVVDLLPMEISKAFDIETAVGPQLDILGEYIGFDRNVIDMADREYFTADDYITPITDGFGFTDYSKPSQNSNATFYSYFGNERTSVLNDAEYRILLKLKILTNISNMSMYDISTMLYAAFGDDLVIGDTYDMTIWYFVASSISRIILIARDNGLLPKPAGVGFGDIFVLNDPAKLWGFKSYISSSGATVGFSSYTAWADAEFLDYNDGIV
jgi:hypothetical protein